MELSTSHLYGKLKGVVNVYIKSKIGEQHDGWEIDIRFG